MMGIPRHIRATIRRYEHQWFRISPVPGYPEWCFRQSVRVRPRYCRTPARYVCTLIDQDTHRLPSSTTGCTDEPGGLGVGERGAPSLRRGCPDPGQIDGCIRAHGSLCLHEFRLNTSIRAPSRRVAWPDIRIPKRPLRTLRTFSTPCLAHR